MTMFQKHFLIVTLTKQNMNKYIQEVLTTWNISDTWYMTYHIGNDDCLKKTSVFCVCF